MATFYKIYLEAKSDKEHYIFLLVIYEPSQFLVQISCLLTTLLSSTRTVAVAKPLHVINKRTVWTALVCSVGLTALPVAVKTVSLIKLIKNPDYVKNSDIFRELRYVIICDIIGYILTGLLVVIVLICSLLTVRALKSSNVDVVTADDEETSNLSSNRKATNMVLLLSFAFVAINSIWLIFLMLVTLKEFHVESTISEDNYEGFSVLCAISVIAMLTNSVANPIIYISRNSKLNKYVRTTTQGWVEKFRRTVSLIIPFGRQEKNNQNLPKL